MKADNEAHYGTVTRILHWGMALLIFWQFLSAGARFFFEDTAIEAFFWPTHKPLGTLLLVLVVLRLLWALINWNKRPPAVNLLSRMGHLTMYVLLVIIPVIALMRQYGSGRVFEPFGIPVFAGFEGERIGWMLELGGTWHGELGWALLALIVGHIVMAWRHRNTKNDVFPRMKG